MTNDLLTSNFFQNLNAEVLAPFGFTKHEECPVTGNVIFKSEWVTLLVWKGGARATSRDSGCEHRCESGAHVHVKGLRNWIKEYTY